MNDKLKHKIIDYLNKEYSGLIIYNTDSLNNYIFFMKDGKVIFDYHKQNGVAYISYRNIWSFLESFFGLKYEEIQSLTKEWIVKYYKLDVTTTYIQYPYLEDIVEEYHKLDVTTTKYRGMISHSAVEKHYKLETNDR
jgi:hypothetical protein